MTERGVAIVTGGAQGLGAAICRKLLGNGYKVCVADINEKTGKEFVEEQQRAYGLNNVLFSQCDVMSEKNHERTLEEAVKVLGGVDVYVNNAGITEDKDAWKLIGVNLIGPIFGCRAALKYMGKSHGGKGGMVINTCSAIVFRDCYPFPLYTASKNGVLGLTRSYGTPYYAEKEGVKFAAFCPCLMDTALTKNLTAYLKENGMEEFELPDMISPDDVAQGVLILLKDKINGSILVTPPNKGYIYVDIEQKVTPAETGEDRITEKREQETPESLKKS